MTSDFESTLSNFTGSETFTRFGLCRDLATEGAIYVAQECEAFWLLDLIASHQLNKNVAEEAFQVWTLTCSPDNSGHVVAEDGNGNVIAEQKLEYAAFPLPKFTLWAVTNETGYKTIMLPSEY